MILIDATYINQSGGKVLLEYFIETLVRKEIVGNFYFLFDDRLESQCVSSIGVNNQQKIDASESNRKLFYKKQFQNIKKVFCFGNVPPPIGLPKRDVFILFHNAFIVESSLGNYNILGRLKYFVKKLYIISKNAEHYIWVVQTSFMKKLITENITKSGQKILVLPFFSLEKFLSVKDKQTNNVKYLYVAEGQKQKNHEYLFEVWKKLMYENNLKPELFLTVRSGNKRLSDQIKSLEAQGLRIQNLGNCSFEEIKQLYSECQYLVYPSAVESFGLPLVEAASAGCKIIANNRPYVFDVVKPSALFDIEDVNSLKNIIHKLYLGEELPQTHIVVQDKIDTLIQMLVE